MTGDNSTAGGFAGRAIRPAQTRRTASSASTGDGFNNSAAISNSQASGNVTAGALSVAGGFAATGGNNKGQAGGSFTNVTASGAVNAGHDSIVGGLVGVLHRRRHGREFDRAQHASWPVQVQTASSAGSSASTKAPSPVPTSTAPVSGTSDSYIGGITGINLGVVTGSSTDPDITGSGGNNFIGGIAGLNAGSISGSTANIALSGGSPNYTGGIAGVNGSFSNTIGDDPEFKLPERHDSPIRARPAADFPVRSEHRRRPGRRALPSWLAGCTTRPAPSLTGGIAADQFGRHWLQHSNDTSSIPANTISVNPANAEFTQPVNVTNQTSPPPVINTASLTAATGSASAHRTPAIRQTRPGSTSGAAASPTACRAAMARRPACA